MSNRASYVKKAARLEALCRKKEGRVLGAEKIADLAMHPEKISLEVPGVSVDDLYGDFQQVQNSLGQTLETTKKNHRPEGKSASRPLWERAAETLIVALFSNSWFILPTLGYSLLLVPRLRVIAFAYILYIKFFSNVHKKASNWFRSDWFRKSWIWRTYASYFPLTLYRSAPLSPQRKYIFGYHPHGVAFRGAMGSLAADGAGFSELFPGIKNTFLMKDEAFKTPLLREYLLSVGLSGVSRQSCTKLLTSNGHDGRGMGQAITITIGGSREYNVSRPGTMEVVVKIRKGFVRVAVETGADLVPVVAFGENDLFDRINVNDSSVSAIIARVWEGVVRHKVAFATGRFNIFCPHRKPLHVVVGKPIPVKQQKQGIDEAYVHELHDKYVTELAKLWDDWKEMFEPNKSVKFEIVE
jgi:2-acylglycerol O-acyltransferase 1